VCLFVIVGQMIGQWCFYRCVLWRSWPARVGNGSPQFQ